MYTRYYDNYESRAANNSPPQNEEISETPPAECNDISVSSLPLLSGLKTDDIILIGLLLLILADGCDDYLLPVILGVLLINK